MTRRAKQGYIDDQGQETSGARLSRAAHAGQDRRGADQACETQHDLSLAYSPGVAEPVPAEVLRAYGLERLEYGPEYIIPKPLDPRLIKTVPPGVARAGYPAHYPKP